MTEEGRGIAVDVEGNAHVTGWRYSGSLADAFAIKVTEDGKGLGYATYLAGVSDDYGWGIGVDPAGYVYLVGRTLSGSGLPVVGAGTSWTSNLRGASDAFVSRRRR